MLELRDQEYRHTPGPRRLTRLERLAVLGTALCTILVLSGALWGMPVYKVIPLWSELAAIYFLAVLMQEFR